MVSTIRCSSVQLPSSTSIVGKASTQHPNSCSVNQQAKISRKNPIKYALVDAFIAKLFKGNPAAVCLLDDEDKRDDGWFIRVAREFNSPNNMLLIDICGHGTLAAAQYLFTCGLVKSDIIEFVGLSGNLTARKVPACTFRISKVLNDGCNGKQYLLDGQSDQKDFSIELDFPTNALVECNPHDIPNIPLTLNGVSVLNVKKTVVFGDILIEVSSGQGVINLKPNFLELQDCKGCERGIYITGKAPEGSSFDFISGVFGPAVGVPEVFESSPFWQFRFWSEPGGGGVSMSEDGKDKKL
ncbi:hypothetical protein MKX03_021592 [Papaver bracteatum]|nr:hypothetical protein MKX03_021592 [Papaver bracteatum]